MSGSSRLPIPVFGKGKKYELYRKEVLLWKKGTDVKAEKQGIYIYLSLPDDDENNIKEKILDAVTTEELEAADGLDKLLAFLDKHLKKDELADEWLQYNDFDDFKRTENMKVDDYVLTFDSLYNKMVKCQMVMPPQFLAFRLLKSAAITKEECLLVMSGLDYTKKAEMYDKAKAALKKFKGENTIGFAKESESDILLNSQGQGQRAYVPPHLRGNSSFRARGQYSSASNSRGRGYSNQASRSFAPSASAVVPNPVGPDGLRRKCLNCESIGHYVRDCPYPSFASQANVAFYDELNDEEVIACLFAAEDFCLYFTDAYIYLILDTGCAATVCGEKWLEVYLLSLPPDQRSSVKMNPSNKIFKFGAGGRIRSLGQCVIPAFLAGRPVNISTDVVDSDIPLLLSKPAMKKAGVKIDTVTDTAEVLGLTVNLDCSSSGHYCLPIHKEQIHEVCAVRLGEDKKASLHKLHRQFAHPATHKLVALLKDAGCADIEDAGPILDEIRENCDVCKQYARAPPRPCVALPMASVFNEKVAMDLKKWGSRWILHLIDMWSRLTLSVFIDRKKPSTVINKIMLHWVAHFGTMESILHDNGGEFSNDEMRAVCSTMNIEDASTAAESPWQNGLCERVHGITDVMLTKLTADYPKTPPEVLLAWANMSRNALQMWNGFSSYQLVFGCNPKVPNVMTDKLPALDTKTSTEIFNQHLNALHAARREFIASEADERLRRALRHKVRVSEEVYNFGDRVFYMRNQSDKWLGPAKVLFQNGKTVFCDHGGVVVKVSPNRLQKANKDPPKQPSETSTESKNNKESVPVAEEDSSDEDSNNPVADQNDENNDETPPERPAEPDNRLEGQHDGNAQQPEPVRRSLRKLNEKHGWQVYCSTVTVDNPVAEALVIEVPRSLHGNPECIEAKEAELQKLQLFEAYQEVEDAGQKCIGTKWVLTYKENGVKARLVAKGFQEKEKVPSDSPTVAKSAMRTLMTLASTNKWNICTTDIKSAFLQGKDLERDLYVKPPKEAKSPPGVIWHLRKTLYGLNDGSRQFYFSVREFLISQGCVVSSVDPSMFIFKEDGVLKGIVISHIDDFLHAGDSVFDRKVMEPLRKRFVAGKVESGHFKYVGLSISQSSSGISVDLDDYIDSISVDKVDVSAFDRPLSKEEISKFRGIVGKLNWIAQSARADKAFDVVELSTKLRSPMLSDLKQAVKVFHRVKEHKSNVLFPPLGKNIALEVFTDASHANLPDGISSTMGLVIFLSGDNHVAPISWRANKIRRVVTSTLAAEAMALQEGIDEAIYLQRMLAEMSLIVPIHVYVDNRGLVDALHSTKLVQDRRLRIVIGALKQTLEREVNAVKWCPGEHQLADCLTKRGANGSQLLGVFQNGLL